MKSNRRLTIRIAGESGMGINSSGEMLVNALKDCGLYVFGYREYPSLIEGGNAFYQVDISETSIQSSQRNTDVMICISRESVFEYLNIVRENGLVIHCIPKLILTEKQNQLIKEKNLQLIFVDTEAILKKTLAPKILTNIILLGLLWKYINLENDQFIRQIKEIFEKKPEVVKVNEKHFDIGNKLEITEKIANLERFDLSKWKRNDLQNHYVITGNHALSLGSIRAGARAYFSYPMTPASSILSYIAATSHTTGVLIKQAEDEISAAQMTLGAMHMGARSFTATSGGGYDLMTETVSLAGITETPMVVVIAQRPGPATGQPTWTSAGDLNLALYSSHGEFPRCVIATSDSKDNFELIQHAFNISEEYQLPVLVLTEKQIAESHFLVDSFNQDIPIKRGLSEGDGKRRYDLATAISPRWLPGTCENWYKANSDEHDELGNSTENAEIAQKMFHKRMEKMDEMAKMIPEPELFGDKEANKIIIGWGSVKNTVLDCLPDKGLAYLHYSYIMPLKTDLIKKLGERGAEFYLIENNYTGQLGRYLQQEIGIKFTDRFLKYDGRPLFMEEINEFIEKICK